MQNCHPVGVYFKIMNAVVEIFGEAGLHPLSLPLFSRDPAKNAPDDKPISVSSPAHVPFNLVVEDYLYIIAIPESPFYGCLNSDLVERQINQDKCIPWPPVPIFSTLFNIQ